MFFTSYKKKWTASQLEYQTLEAKFLESQKKIAYLEQELFEAKQVEQKLVQRLGVAVQKEVLKTGTSAQTGVVSYADSIRKKDESPHTHSQLCSCHSVVDSPQTFLASNDEVEVAVPYSFYEQAYEKVVVNPAFFQFQSSLSQLCQTLKSEINRIEEATISITAQTRLHVSEIASCAEHASKNNVLILNQMKVLDQKAEKINEIINVISGVAAQTNLLSLNASIEAARAGEAGRGFGVVAQAVRELSQSTDQSTQKISVLIQDIQKEISVLKTSVEKVSEDNQLFNQISAKLHHEINKILELSNEIKTIFSQSVLKSFLELIKVDHLIYKFEIYKVFSGTSQKKPKDFASHHECRLGKWYYKGEGQGYSQIVGYKQIETPHRRFHEAGVEAVRAFYNKEFEKALQHLSTLERESLNVMNALDQLASNAS